MNRSARRRVWILAAVGAVAMIAYLLARGELRRRLSTSFFSSSDALEAAYRTSHPLLTRHQSAEAVIAGAEGLTVLATARPTREVEHTWLIRLSDDGRILSETHATPENGAGRALAARPGGAHVVAGELRVEVMAYRGVLLGIGGDGSIAARTLLGPPGVTGLNAVAALPEGAVIAGGVAAHRGWLLKADAALHIVWDRALPEFEDVRAIVPLGADRIAIAGAQESSTTELAISRLAVVDDTGQAQWTRRFPESGRGELAAIAAAASGAIFAIGHKTQAAGAATGTWIIAVTADGEPIWERVIGTPEEERRGRAIAVMAGGDLAIASETWNGERRLLRVARLAPDGTVRWERGYDEEGYQVARGLVQARDGGLVVVGSTTSGAGRTNVWIFGLDADGAMRWQHVLETRDEPR